MTHPIEVINLHHRYGRRVIYESLNFTVKPGKIFGLLGKNGVGKTTLINILMGFLRPTAGKCLVLGEDSHNLSPAARSRIGLLHEGHLAYEFMTIEQVEKYYSGFYPRWRKDLYYDLVNRMGLAPTHKIANMSCGQRSQVVLGAILAQDPQLMILDDYSMGLDAGYRRLFLDYLKEYVGNKERTAFITSHIVQDMEKLVDEIIFIGKDGFLLQTSLDEFMNGFKQYRFTPENNDRQLPAPNEVIIGSDYDNSGQYINIYSFKTKSEVSQHLAKNNFPVSKLKNIPMTLEDAFIGLMGKY